MSHSHPSIETYVIDVPEVIDLVGSFKYNFYVDDELTSDTGGTPVSVLQRPAETVDSAFVDYATRTSPRFNVLSWRTPKIVPVDASAQVRNDPTRLRNNPKLISENLDKLVSEGSLVGHRMANVPCTANDDDVLLKLTSGSNALRALGGTTEQSASRFKAAVQATRQHSNISPGLLIRSLTDVKSSGISLGSGERENVRKSKFNIQLNSDIIHSTLVNSSRDPGSFHGLSQLGAIREVAKLLGSRVHDDVNHDFKTYVPYIDIQATALSPGASPATPEIVGYIVDKFEHLSNGTTKKHDPIIIESAATSRVLDPRVKYGSTYTYTVKSVALFTVVAVDDDTGQSAIVKVLVSSRPSNKVTLSAVETVPPPPPVDLKFTWDWDRVNPETAEHDRSSGQMVPGTGQRGSLMLSWAFPTNPQRDIKKFQIFRRRSLDEPFELIREHDFGGSTTSALQNETPDPSLVDLLKSPRNFFFDDDFTADVDVNAPVIYAMCCIDAHGMTSNYSSQHEVYFDRFANRLVHRLISHSGAPKAYPNMYLEGELYVNTIRTAGSSSRRLSIYFNPSQYQTVDASGRKTKTFGTVQDGTSYRLQFINLDSQLGTSLQLQINDARKLEKSTIARQEVQLLGRRLRRR